MYSIINSLIQFYFVGCLIFLLSFFSLESSDKWIFSILPCQTIEPKWARVVNDGMVCVLDFWVWTLDLLLNHRLWLLCFVLGGGFVEFIDGDVVVVGKWVIFGWALFLDVHFLGLLMGCSNLFLHIYIFFGVCVCFLPYSTQLRKQLRKHYSSTPKVNNNNDNNNNFPKLKVENCDHP